MVPNASQWKVIGLDTFAFILHPLEIKDVARKFGFAKNLPERWLETAFSRLPALKVSEITGVRSTTGKEVKGWFVACPLTARQMMELPEAYVMKKIIQAAKKAEDLGAQIVGLGAFTSVVGDAGITVDKAVGIPVTTGNSYTVATALSGIEYAAELLGKDLHQSNVTVLGASGSIGKACARIMARRGYHVTLVARRREPLEEVADLIRRESGQEAEIETEIEAGLRNADVVIAVTSAVEAVVDGQALKTGAIVCDVARPRNVARAIVETRDDVFIFEGGVVAPPGDVEFNFNFGFPPKTCYACMAETMALALEGRFESFSLGRNLEVEKIDEIDAIAGKHGFTLAGLRSFERAVTRQDVERVLQAVAARNGDRKTISMAASRLDTP